MDEVSKYENCNASETSSENLDDTPEGPPVHLLWDSTFDPFQSTNGSRLGYRQVDEDGNTKDEEEDDDDDSWWYSDAKALESKYDEWYLKQAQTMNVEKSRSRRYKGLFNPTNVDTTPTTPTINQQERDGPKSEALNEKCGDEDNEFFSPNASSEEASPFPSSQNSPRSLQLDLNEYFEFGETDQIETPGLSSMKNSVQSAELKTANMAKVDCQNNPNISSTKKVDVWSTSERNDKHTGRIQNVQQQSPDQIERFGSHPKNASFRLLDLPSDTFCPFSFPCSLPEIDCVDCTASGFEQHDNDEPSHFSVERLESEILTLSRSCSESQYFLMPWVTSSRKSISSDSMKLVVDTTNAKKKTFNKSKSVIFQVKPKLSAPSLSSSKTIAHCDNSNQTRNPFQYKPFKSDFKKEIKSIIQESNQAYDELQYQLDEEADNQFYMMNQALPVMEFNQSEDVEHIFEELRMAMQNLNAGSTVEEGKQEPLASRKTAGKREHNFSKEKASNSEHTRSNQRKTHCPEDYGPINILSSGNSTRQAQDTDSTNCFPQVSSASPSSSLNKLLAHKAKSPVPSRPPPRRRERYSISIPTSAIMRHSVDDERLN